MLPSHEPNEKFYRLLASVLEYLHKDGDVWAAVSYFGLWAVRLAGVLPEMRVSDESAAIAQEMFVKPISALTPRAWTKATCQDMRRHLVRAMEQHAERRFLTAPMLEAL